MLRMIRQTRIQDGRYRGVTGKKVSNSTAVYLMLLHAHRQRFNPTQHQKALERRKNASGAFLHKSKCLRVIRPGSDQDTAQTVTVAIEKLGRGVHHKVRTPLQW